MEWLQIIQRAFLFCVQLVGWIYLRDSIIFCEVLHRVSALVIVWIIIGEIKDILATSQDIMWNDWVKDVKLLVSDSYNTWKLFVVLTLIGLKEHLKKHNFCHHLL